MWLVTDAEGYAALLVHLRIQGLVLQDLRRGRLDEDARSALFHHLITGHGTFGQGQLERRFSFTLRHDAQACLHG